eukprot:6491257-Amphidinium_carterae.2
MALPVRVRPDIQFAVKELRRKLSSPTSKDESAAKHLIRYLRGTQNLVFRIAPSSWKSSQCIELHAYCDSDWAGCPVSRKSTCGPFWFQGSALGDVQEMSYDPNYAQQNH